MSFMTDAEKIFLDTNILVYLVGQDDLKREKVRHFLNPELIISTQVIVENVNVCLKKFKLDKELAFAHGQMLQESFKVVTITTDIISLSFSLSKRYQFGLWDSLIIAAALHNKCSLLYSEDMQDGLVIEKSLTIINSFKITTLK